MDTTCSKRKNPPLNLYLRSGTFTGMQEFVAVTQPA